MSLHKKHILEGLVVNVLLKNTQNPFLDKQRWSCSICCFNQSKYKKYIEFYFPTQKEELLRTYEYVCVGC